MSSYYHLRRLMYMEEAGEIYMNHRSTLLVSRQ